MTDQPHPPKPNPGTSPPPALGPGGGRQLRHAYTILLAVTLTVIVIMVPFPVYLATQSIGDPDMPILLPAGVTAALTSICAITALIRGRTAVHDDQLNLAAIHASRRIARAGSIIGYLGTTAVAAAGVSLHYQHVSNALLMGFVFALACLLVMFCNDAAHRTAKRLTTGHPTA